MSKRQSPSTVVTDLAFSAESGGYPVEVCLRVKMSTG